MADAHLLSALIEAAEIRRERLVEVVTGAVRIPSVTGAEGDAAAFFAEQCRRLDVDLDVWSPDIDELRAHRAFVGVEYDYVERNNVVATRRGAGGGCDLVLYGHVDTVPTV